MSERSTSSLLFFNFFYLLHLAGGGYQRGCRRGCHPAPYTLHPYTLHLAGGEGVREFLGHAEVRYFEAAVTVEENVGGLDVPIECH